MVNGDKKVGEDFTLLNQNQARMILKGFIKNDELLEELVELVDSDMLSGFQLKDICTNNYGFEQIKNAITVAIALTNLHENPNAATLNDIKEVEEDSEEEDEDKKKERIGFPSYNIEELMKEVGLEDKMDKVREAEIDAELFWEMEDEVLEKTLEIKIMGQRKQLLQRMKEIKNDHEQVMEAKHDDSKRVKPEGL